MLLVPVSAAAQQAPAVPTLTTSGSGRVTLVPDRAVLLVVVETQAASATEAGAQNAARVAAILDSVRSQVLSNDTVRLVGYDTDPVRGFVNHVYSIIAYKVRSTVRVPLDRPEQLGQLIDLVLKAGATEIGGARFESDSLEAARKVAVGLAVKQAQSIAGATALAAGVELGDLSRLESRVFDGQDIPWAAGYRGGRFVDMSPAVTESPRGHIEVSAQVEAEWRLVAGRRR